MGVHPVIQAIENPYSKWWWNGWVVGLISGLALATAAIVVSAWAGYLSVWCGL
jgi:hypothetical protein